MGWHRHFGVYGICVDEAGERLLVIRKAAGHYGAGRYDLPGGSMEPQESLAQAIQREFLEETGWRAKVVQSLGVYDVLVRFPFKGTTHTHHMGALYEVRIDQSERQEIPEFVKSEESNDSTGTAWVPLQELTLGNSSPLVMKAVRWIQSGELAVEMEEYHDWRVLEG